MEVFVILKKNKAEIASLTTLAFEFKHRQKKKKEKQNPIVFSPKSKALA